MTGNTAPPSIFSHMRAADIPATWDRITITKTPALAGNHTLSILIEPDADAFPFGIRRQITMTPQESADLVRSICDLAVPKGETPEQAAPTDREEDR